MTFAIQHTLLYPERVAGVEPTLDFQKLMTLDFRPVDPARYPFLQLTHDVMRAGNPKVEDRRAYDVEPGAGAVQPDQRPSQPCRAQTRHLVRLKYRAELSSRRVGAPIRWPQPGHAAAFLIDSDHGVRWQDIAQRCR